MVNDRPAPCRKKGPTVVPAEAGTPDVHGQACTHPPTPISPHPASLGYTESSNTTIQREAPCTPPDSPRPRYSSTATPRPLKPSGRRENNVSQESKESSGAEGKRRVLQGYQQRGKRFIPPFLQLQKQMALSENSWIDDRVPELVWIALLINSFGIRQGSQVAVDIATAAAKCAPDTHSAFAAVSNYALLTAEQEDCVRLALHENGMLDKAQGGLAALINDYPQFPLACLAEPTNPSARLAGSTLNDLKAALSNIVDREGTTATFVQATAVYIYFLNNKLKVSPGLGLSNFPAIEDYPMTEESRMVAASVRSFLVVALTKDVPIHWRLAFWNRGRELGSCEVSS